MVSICVIEDEVKVSAFIQKGLHEHGYTVACFTNSLLAMQHLETHSCNLALLDVGLPGINGFETCRLLKARWPGMRVIMLTALDSVADKVQGFKAGADDYLPKPFHFDELLARIEAVTRRDAQAATSEVITFADLTLNTQSKTAYRATRSITLTAREYTLLELFMLNPKKVLSREYIAEKVWGLNFDTGTNVIDVYINYLRKKITAGTEARLIHTVIGMGYVLKQA